MTNNKNITLISDYSSSPRSNIEVEHDPVIFYEKSGGGGGGSDVVARIVKLEADVEYIKRDISEIKTDFKDFKTSVNSDFKAVNQKLDNIPIALAQFETRLIKYIVVTIALVSTISFTIARFL